MSIRPTKYRLMPNDLEAIKVKPDNLQAVADWCGGEVFPNPKDEQGNADSYLYIPNTQGNLTAEVGTYVTRDTRGRFGVITAKRFESRYTPVNEIRPDFHTHRPSMPPNLGAYGKPNLGVQS